jgi:hypothetical protein
MSKRSTRASAYGSSCVISRIWHGWTDPANADAYEEMLRSVVLCRFDERVMHYETILAPD